MRRYPFFCAKSFRYRNGMFMYAYMRMPGVPSYTLLFTLFRSVLSVWNCAILHWIWHPKYSPFLRCFHFLLSSIQNHDDKFYECICVYITYDEKWGVQSTRLTEPREIRFPQSSVLQFPPHWNSQRTASHHQCQLSISSLLI